MSNRSAFAAAVLAASQQTSVMALAGVLISLASAPAVAEAVTYTGTVGARAIVLELTEFEDGPVLGRYSYQSNGADIPLHALSASQSDTVLADSLTEGLDVSFAQDDVATFLLDNIPDGGREGPVVSVPLAGIKGLLTDKAVDYFPALQSPEARR